jgi:hypothetical protein
MILYVIVGIILALVGMLLIKGLIPVMWKNKGPKKRLRDIINEFGEPDFICKRPGGFARWTEKTLTLRGFPLYEIWMFDEEIVHSYPEPHKDFLYMGYRIDIPEDKLQMVLGISKSVWYDRLKGVLWARCHFSGATIATLNEAIKIIEGTSTGSSEEYAMSIFKTVKKMKDKYDPHAYDEYMKNLAEKLVMKEGISVYDVYDKEPHDIVSAMIDTQIVTNAMSRRKTNEGISNILGLTQYK